MIDYPTRNWLAIAVRLHGTVIPRVAGRTLACMLLAAIGAYLEDAAVANLSIPVVVHTIVGVALGLMLVFRTNASYDRYWEGRRLLGGMVNTCRDLSRQTRTLLQSGEARQLSGRYIVALYASIRRYLRRERSWPELEAVLSQEELAALASRRAPPLLVAQWLSELLSAEAEAGRLSEQRLTLFDRNLTQMIDLWGGAERIHNTPVPFAYAHHIKVFLALFCFTVPFALLPALGWYSVVGAGVVAFGMFGIDEIGLEIEDPFGYDPNDLPMDAIGELIDADVRQTVADGPDGSERDN
jgi:ion channel-forming bestrophin family protein